MITYDQNFNANEWFVLITLAAGILCVFLVPRRFPWQASIVFFMCGVYSGFFFDHSLSVMPVSYYDVNDVSNFQLMDFLSYWIYGAFSYFFFYIYDRIHPKPSFSPIYVLVYSLISVGFEWLAVQCDVFHYRHGYHLAYSFPIYLVVQSCWMGLYYRFLQKGYLKQVRVLIEDRTKPRV